MWLANPETFWLVLNWFHSDMKSIKQKKRVSAKFAKSPERPNGLCSGWYQFHRYNMLSKSTVVALCSLLVWFNFISALDILMKALLVCCIDLVSKLVPLQWYSYFKFAFSMYSYIRSNYMWPHKESREN